MVCALRSSCLHRRYGDVGALFVQAATRGKRTRVGVEGLSERCSCEDFGLAVFLSKERSRRQRTLANFKAYREQERVSRKHHYTDNECVLQVSCVMFDGEFSLFSCPLLVVLLRQGSDQAYGEPNALTSAYGLSVKWTNGLRWYSRSWEAGPLCPPGPIRVEEGHDEEICL